MGQLDFFHLPFVFLQEWGREEVSTLLQCKCVTLCFHSLDRAPLKSMPAWCVCQCLPLCPDCHSYLHCKYGKRCSGRDLKITPPRVSVTKLINWGTGVEQVLTKWASFSSHSLSSQPRCPIFLSFSFDCGLIRLNYMEILSFIIGMGSGLSSPMPNKYYGREIVGTWVYLWTS